MIRYYWNKLFHPRVLLFILLCVSLLTMPITSSAKKALRASKHKAVYNLKRKDAIVDIVKKIKKSVKFGKVKEAEAMLSTAFKSIDKACKTNLIHKNTAARKKSRLAKMLAKASAAK